jgi:hypothetical protein
MIGFSVCMILIFASIFLSMPKKGDVVVINCGISEISPDFTNEMRQECRKLRMEQK